MAAGLDKSEEGTDQAADDVRELLEVLPNCFADEAEARLFAAKLPLTSAVRAANAEIARLRQLWREQKGIDQKFWAAAIEAGRLATGEALADDENL